MPSIAIFHSTLTQEEKIRDTIAQMTGFSIVSNEKLLEKAGRRFSISPKKLEKAMYQKTSVFNRFTLERERSVAALKSVLADKLVQPQNIYFGFISLLIPPKVTHVLKVLLVDSKEIRTKRAMEQGMNLKEAKKVIKESDLRAFDWTEFLYGMEPWDSKLYDIVIPVNEKTVKEIAQLVSEQCAQGTILEREASKKGVAEMALCAKIEMAMLQKGYVADVEIANNIVTLNVNKSVINFDGLSAKLQEMITPIAQPYKVVVKKGKNYTLSIYRDQEFKLPPTVLLVDDEKDFALTLSERLISRNVGSYAVFDGQEALDFLNNDSPDVIVLDLKMPGVGGLEVLEMVKKNNPSIEVIILTGHGSEEDRQNCLELGAFAYLQKPTDIKKLSAIIHEAHTKAVSLKIH